MNLINAGKCTSSIILIRGGRRTVVGTAFFIAPSILVTAGYCVASAKKRGAILIASPPGLAFVDIQKVAGIECTVKESFREPDIAILKCEFESDFLQIELEQLVCDSTIDIIGYPRDITTARCRQRITPKNKSLAETLFPQGHLTVTSGKRPGTIFHEAPTCPGMSGGCVLVNGKAIGIFNLRIFLLTSRSSYWAHASTYDNSIQR
jgi:hypothetical protein